MEEIFAPILTHEGKQILPPTTIEQVRALSARLLAISDEISSLQGLIKPITENGFNVVDAEGNIAMKYDENGLDVAAISSHMQGLIKSIDGLGLALGETTTTAYAGNKGKANADAISALLTSLSTLTTNNNADHKTYNDGILSLQGSLRTLSTAVSVLQSLITQVTENGFHVTDSNGNVGMQYDDSGLDAALLSTHFQGLINSLISTLINSAKGSTIAPLVNSLIPAVYLPSFVDDAVEINLFGTSAIEEYCSANDGNTSTLEDQFAYDNENKIFQIARQVGTSIDLIDAGVPEKGKIYTDTSTNKTYRWGGTTMVPIGSDMVLGEDSATAYAGDKGKQNADNIATLLSICSKLNISVTEIKSQLISTQDDGLFICDSNGNVIMKYDANGFDFASISTHAVSVLNAAGITGGTSLKYNVIKTL